MGKSRPLTFDQLVLDLRRLGVQSGQCVMVHASLRSLGALPNRAAIVLDALERVLGPDGTLMMVLGSECDWDWVNKHIGGEHEGMLARAEPFDALQTPADADVGYLAEALRRRNGTIVSDNPEGRFAANGTRAEELLRDAPWDDYFGHGSPLEKFCEFNGKVLRIGADMDTTTVLHFAEYLVPIADKKRVTRHRRVLRNGEPRVITVSCLDDSDGIVEWEGEDYFKIILVQYLADGRGASGRIGEARCELIDANDLVGFGVNWMAENFKQE